MIKLPPLKIVKRLRAKVTDVGKLPPPSNLHFLTEDEELVFSRALRGSVKVMEVIH